MNEQGVVLVLIRGTDGLLHWNMIQPLSVADLQAAVRVLDQGVGEYIVDMTPKAQEEEKDIVPQEDPR